jgi:hypothetical protein
LLDTVAEIAVNGMLVLYVQPYTVPDTAPPTMLRNGMFQPPPGGVCETPKTGPFVLAVTYTQADTECELLPPNHVPSGACT